ncbi:MAG: cytochrome c [Deltaproteobacteria bacterium]|jgi:hypothetical protein|nr:cytochrome c [Deltaproteobacteria bacterium]
MMILLFACALVACALPGRDYLVSPPISGRVHAQGEAIPESSLLLRIQHRETPNLHRQAEVPLSPGGAFEFEAAELAIAGHEFSKYYRAQLMLRTGTGPRVIWRAEFSRRQLAGPIGLDCDLERPRSQGQPCWVEDPLAQPWLVAAGDRTFQRLCATCHGPDGSGSSGAIEQVGFVPPDLRLIAARREGVFDRAEISEWVEGRALPSAHGSRAMPIWGLRLSQEYERYAEGDALIGPQLDPVVVYLESLQTEPGPP